MVSDRLTPRARGALKWTGIALGGLSAVFVLTYLLRWQLFGGVVRGKAADALGELLRADVRIGEASGSLVRSLELRDVELVPREGSLLTRQGRIGRAYVLYSPTGGLRRVEVEDVELAFAAPAEPESRKSWREYLETALATLEALPELPEVAARNVAVRFSGVTVVVDRAEVSTGEKGVYARLVFSDDTLRDLWAASGRTLLASAGYEHEAVSLELSGSRDGKREGLALTVGRADHSGVRPEW